MLYPAFLFEIDIMDLSIFNKNIVIVSGYVNYKTELFLLSLTLLTLTSLVRILHIIIKKYGCMSLRKLS